MNLEFVASINELNGAASKMLSTITGRTIQEEARNPNENVVMSAGQKMELVGTRPTHARAQPGTQSPVKLCQTCSRDAFRRRAKPKYRKRY